MDLVKDVEVREVVPLGRVARYGMGPIGELGRDVVRDHEDRR